MISRLRPILKEKMWGGDKLRTQFGFKTDSDSIGECWGISGFKGDESVLEDGPYEGETLRWLWQNHPELFGHPESCEFPILVKLIDAQDDLSIQVHPDDAYAKTHEDSFGKSECWYILDAEENTDIIIGHKAKTYDTFKRFVDENRFEALVNTHPVKKGDTFHIEPGTLHAIKEGTVLLEIQQSSDVTYRFYDYERLFNGELRELHLKDAMQVVKIPDDTVKRGLSSDYFEVEQVIKEKTLPPNTHGTFLAVTEGTPTINKETYSKGTFLIASNDETLDIDGDAPFEVMAITIR